MLPKESVIKLTTRGEKRNAKEENQGCYYLLSEEMINIKFCLFSLKRKIEQKDLITLCTHLLQKDGANGERARCLKITEKVSFNIASESSNVYILSGQKFI